VPKHTQRRGKLSKLPLLQGAGEIVRATIAIHHVTGRFVEAAAFSQRGRRGFAPLRICALSHAVIGDMELCLCSGCGAVWARCGGEHRSGAFTPRAVAGIYVHCDQAPCPENEIDAICPSACDILRQRTDSNRGSRIALLTPTSTRKAPFVDWPAIHIAVSPCHTRQAGRRGFGARRRLSMAFAHLRAQLRLPRPRLLIRRRDRQGKELARGPFTTRCARADRSSRSLWLLFLNR